MTYHTTREEYRQTIMHNLCKLAQMIEADHDDGARWLARSIENDTASYFDADRWKPQPIAAGIMERVPVGQPVTLVIQHYAYPGHANRQVIRGKVQKMHAAYKPADGVQFTVIPQRCRNERRYYYRHQPTAHFAAYAGYLSEAELASGQHAPLYYCEHPEQAAD